MDHKKIEVDGVEYIIMHPSVDTALDIGFEIAGYLGESIASFINGGPDALPEAVKTLLMKLKPQDARAFMIKVLATVEAQGSSKILLDKRGIDLHFKGRIGSMVGVVAETLAFTHGDFSPRFGRESPKR